jgi:hypothetical protein
VNEYHAKSGFNFEIKPEDTIKNPGLRQVAKICLNSLWDKFGQRCGMDDYEFFFDYNTLIRKFINNQIIPTTWNIISENCVELRFKDNADTHIENDYISEITAVFTTANARVFSYISLKWNSSLPLELSGNTGTYKSLGGTTSHLTNPIKLSFIISSGVISTYFLKPTA